MKIGNLEVYGIIYKIQNMVNGKVYIGQTTRGFNERYRGNRGDSGIARVKNHIEKLKEKETKGYNSHLLSAIYKYGEENFLVKEDYDFAFSKKELDIKEQTYICLFNSFENGYNKNLGGSGNKGWEGLSGADNPIAKAVVQLSKKGKFIKKWDCIKDAENSLGIPSSKISGCCNGTYGRKSTGGYMWVFLEDYDNSKNFTYENLCGRYNKVSVVKLDKQGNFIKQYNSLTEAEEDNEGVNGSKITLCCRGERKTHKNFIWIYTHEYDKNKDYSLKDSKYGRYEVPVVQLDLDNNFVKEYQTLGQALKELNIKANHISDCCLGKRKTCGGFKWRYSEDYYKTHKTR